MKKSVRLQTEILTRISIAFQGVEKPGFRDGAGAFKDKLIP